VAYVDVCRFTATSSGTGDFVVSAAVTGYQTPASAGALDQAPYYYRAESADLSQWEVGSGTYTVSTTTLSRSTVLFNSSGTTSKISFSSAPQVAVVALGEGLREKLTANRTYYVNESSGSDSNSGLTSADAFATLAHCWSVITSIDLGGYSVTISLASNVTTGLSINAPWIGGNIVLDGGGHSISSTGAAFATSVPLPGLVTIQNITLASSGGNGVEVQAAGVVSIGSSVTFGACSGAHFNVGNYGYVSVGANYSVTGAAASHYFAGRASIVANSRTVTFTGTLNFSTAFCYIYECGVFEGGGMTFSGGTITGQRYNVYLNGVIQTGGGGATYFPGNSSGTTATGGQYA